MQSEIKNLAEKLQSGETTAVRLLDSAYKIIEEKEPKINAFISLMKEQAQRQAEEIDGRRKAGEKLSVLAGIPCAIKDMICIAETKTTAASKMLENFVPPYDAEVITRLRNNGAVFVGKTNLDEFAMGSSTEFSIVGPTHNPLDNRLVAGGSSGGSAAAVASGMVPYALGTDTGGSIREPASFCGIVGFKPTYGRISRSGVIAYASSFDQVGPLARTVEDTALVYEAIAGPDPKDSTTLPASVPSVLPTMRDGVKGLRIGVPKEFFSEGVDKEVATTVKKAIDELQEKGAIITEVSLPLTDVALAVYLILTRAEASTNLARYDGVRFGLRSDGKTMEEIYRKTRGAGFGVEVKQRIMLGTFALSSGYADKYYRQATAVRREIALEYARIFEQVDVLVGPATPEVAFPIGSKTNDPLRMYAADVLTVPVNVAGVPAIVVPCGKAHDLPVGLQIIAAQGREDLCFRVAASAEASNG
ncbi:MAG: Asp-tRNA(Asn)/Glu-tRNA(Gln) amidotransferase subunit GatA [bacterium]|nr:Asp-tRNA(Asn)/Glu-tRNA(Gln) amidotransferase subunit GatA [bacterium]